MNISARTIYFILFSALLFIALSGAMGAVPAYAMDTANTQATQIIVIPFITAGLIYMNRRNVFRSVSYSIPPGVLLTLSSELHREGGIPFLSWDFYCSIPFSHFR
jgi:hypothetical protein